jgi:hypothetical protein
MAIAACINFSTKSLFIPLCTCGEKGHGPRIKFVKYNELKKLYIKKELISKGINGILYNKLPICG